MSGAPRTNPIAFRGAQDDLAARVRKGAEALQERLEGRDALVEMIRSVNATLEPRKVADALLGQVHSWFSAGCLAVAVHDGPEKLSLVAERGSWQPFGEAILKVGRWVTQHNDEFMSANLQSDRRLADSTEATVMAFPLRARAQAIGA